jgi:hypothetical protein
MINKELNEKLQEIEEEYDVELMTVEDVQEFLQSDLDLMKQDFEQEIQWSKEHSNLVQTDPMETFLYGMEQGLQIAEARYKIRIDEGF